VFSPFTQRKDSEHFKVENAEATSYTISAEIAIGCTETARAIE
jgi:hypothetical protein